MGAGRKQVLVVEQAAHVAVDGHMRLPPRREVARELGRDADDAMHRPLPHLLLGILHAGAEACDADIGRGVHLPGELTAEAAPCIVHQCHRHLARHLLRVDESVDERVRQRHEDEENEHPLVAERVLHFLLPDVEQAPEALPYLLL